MEPAGPKRSYGKMGKIEFQEINLRERGGVKSGSDGKSRTTGETYSTREAVQKCVWGSYH